MEDKKMKGKVKFFSDPKGFGFIVNEEKVELTSIRAVRFFLVLPHILCNAHALGTGLQILLLLPDSPERREASIGRAGECVEEKMECIAFLLIRQRFPFTEERENELRICIFSCIDLTFLVGVERHDIAACKVISFVFTIAIDV